MTTPTPDGSGANEQEPVDWNRTFIKGRAYGNDENLSTRQSIYAFAKWRPSRSHNPHRRDDVTPHPQPAGHLSALTCGDTVKHIDGTP